MRFEYGYHGTNNASEAYRSETDEIYNDGLQLGLTMALLGLEQAPFAAVKTWLINPKPVVKDYRPGNRCFFISGFKACFN